MSKLIIAIVTLGFFANSLFAQTNLLQNPGFEETVTVGWWLNTWGGTEGELLNETGPNVITGTISAKINVTLPDASTIAKVSLMSDPISNVPDGELLLKVTARTELAVDQPFQISLMCTAEDGSKKYYSSSEFSIGTTPQIIEFTSLPETAYRNEIVVRLSCGKSAGVYLFDDVSLTIIEPTPLEVPTGRSYREIVAEKYPDGNVFIGGTTQGPLLGTISEDLLNREFSYITPANDFKQSYIHPEPDKWQWELPDTWVQKAQDNGQVIRMHGPISPQCSKWAKEDSRTAEELLQNLEEYVTAQCQRYNDYDNILWMDVVNETIDSNTGEWFGPKPGTDKWENPWPKIGYDTTDPLNPPLYIKRAFELANEHAPDIKQIINQHGSMNEAAWDKVKALVMYLRENGLRVDGIGWQAHVNVGWENEDDNIQKLSDLIDWAHANDLEFHVTENNVFLRNGNEGKFEEQAATYRAIVETVLSKRNTGIVTWNAWILRDGIGMNGEYNPSIFNNDGSPKPAYYAVQSALEDNTTSVNNNSIIPEDFKLYNCYPNPFNQSTQITFDMTYQSNVKLIVYDARGRMVQTLVDKSVYPGKHAVEWNGTNQFGQKVSNGTYFAHLLVNGNFHTIKMMLLQ